MKRLISLILITVLLLTAVVIMPIGASAAAAFQEGDVLYLKIENPTNWADNATLYVNFTDASRAENGDRSIVIAEADPDRYHPVTGVTYDSDLGLYKYVVTADDAGATVMRFWRGNVEKLWNESVVLSADDLAGGKNTTVVTDWTATGYLTSTYEFDLGAMMGVSNHTGEIGDPFDIFMDQNDPPAGTRLYRELYINDELVSDMPNDTYTFNPEADGVYNIKGVFTVLDSNDHVIAKDTKTDTITIGSAPITALEPNCVYAHAAKGAEDKEAWIKWYKVDGVYYFFMPSSAKAFDSVELYNTYSTTVIINGTSIPANGVATFAAQPKTTYHASIEVLDLAIDVQFLFSSAEAALWVNNTDNFDGYSDFFSYLQASKENSVAASGAVSTPDGKIEQTPVKKMKGRGNTSWNADKKGFNVTFESTIKLAGMDKGKKFSLVSNFQDAAMARNRILFDLADEVGVPYSSDSRFIDLYTNGEYQGTYQICQKIDVGKNTLISDFDSDDYLDPETGGVKSDFCFVTEIDSSPGADDFHFTARNGNNLTMKAPEPDEGDPNRDAIQNYVKSKYSAMYNRLRRDTIGDYLDITSMAKVYIINELGKNWDSGASSFYFTYKPDENGVYKFYASPVWDYDNSLGNANGVERDLRNMGITDYTLPSGWFSTKKGGYNGPNVLAESVENPLIMAEVRRVWFEEFVPAIEKLAGTSGVNTGEIWSSDVYADYLRDSADMNYKIWDLVTNTSWIADHSSLTKYSATYTKNTYGQVTGVNLTQDNAATRYNQYTFDGQFNYMMDWMTSRAAWISAQYINDYVPSEPATEPTQAPTEAPTDPPTEPPTEAPTIPPEDVIIVDFTNAVAAWAFDATDKTPGNKLTEYGNADDGYNAVEGHGKMTLSVSGDKNRALEWSDPEYGHSGTLMTPIMAAGSKNQWGSPYINLELPTAKDYDEMSITAYFAGSNKAPASWKLQYSTDGAVYTDIDDAEFTISADNRKVITAYFDKTMLPDFVYNEGDEALNLRLVPVTMTTIEGGNALDTPSSGELAVNCLAVYGHKITDDDYILGDADQNEELEIIDATVIQRYLVGINGMTARGLKAADVTKDDELDIIDVTVIQRALAGIPNPYLNID